jgi:hypothetical protein
MVHAFMQGVVWTFFCTTTNIAIVVVVVVVIIIIIINGLTQIELNYTL